VTATCADISDFVRDLGFKPSTPVEFGVRRFVEWYRSYYNSESRLEAHDLAIA